MKAFALLLFTIILHQGTALECYACESGYEVCRDQFDKSLGIAITCPEVVDTACYKYSYLQGETEESGRGCSNKNGTEYCDFVTAEYQALNITLTFCETCNTQYCNASSVQSMSWMLFGFLLLLKCILGY